MRTMIIPGGNGYLGQRVAASFIQRDWNVTILTRSTFAPMDGVKVMRWDGRTLGDWAGAIDGADVVLNLAGRTVNCRYNEKNKAEIYSSRLESTRVIGRAISAAAAPPPLWLNAASATIYRDAEDRPMDEAAGEIGSGFSVDVCRKWEAELFAAATPKTRRVALRTAMVMGPGKDGVFEAFYGIVRKRLGGTLGPGTQYVSWIELEDFCRALEFLIEHSELDGPVNVSAPNPIPNRQFMRELRQAAGIRIGLPATKWMLAIGAVFLGTETELLLKSRRVLPKRLMDAGFTFLHSDWAEAAGELAKGESHHPMTAAPSRLQARP